MLIRPCPPYALQERASAIVSFFHVVPAGVTFEEATSTTYWRDAWKVMENKPYSTIDLLADDGAWEAKVRILAATNGIVKFRTLSRWEPEKKAGNKPTVPQGMRVDHMPGKGWRAIAKDGTVILEGEPVEADAVKAAIAYDRKVTA